MKYYSMRELSNDTKMVCEEVKTYGNAMVTNNGKPSLLLFDVTDKDPEEFMKAFIQAKTMMAVNKMRAIAAAEGYMTDEEIDAEIKAARMERREYLKKERGNEQAKERPLKKGADTK